MLMLFVAALVSPAVAADEPAGGSQTLKVVPTGAAEALAFYAFAGVAVVSCIGIAVTGNIVRMATWLFGTLGAVAALYFLLAANLLGAVQLIVYAGGTLILIIFGVMLTSKSPWVRFDAKRGEIVAAGVVCLVLFVALASLLTRADWPGERSGAPAMQENATVATIGKELLTTYLLPFEVASVLLLSVMIGAAFLARPEKD